MPHLFPLFEHAAGYALFKTIKFKDLEEDLKPTVQQNLVHLEGFKCIVQLVAFNPFKNTRHALDNMNSLSEGILHPELETFLESSVAKKDKNVIGIADTKLAAAISELGYTCSSDKVVHDLIRGIRTHFHNLVEGFEDASAATKSQLGLGHYYSRARVKFNVNRMDNMIIQSISLLDQLDKDINTFTMRVREWYSLHFPELLQVVPENTVFIQCVNVIKNRKEIDGLEDELDKILNDSTKVAKIMVLARSSMGMDIGGPDLENVYHFVDRIIALSQKRKEIMEYLKSKMNNVAPNLATLIGDVVGARLIAHSGSLTNLAKAPASTVQILGAEKALFRALKTRGNTPKFGLLFHSKFIAKAAKQNKGRISRYLANKCSVASRIDCFRDNPTNVFGEKLRGQVENRLKFYETGEVPLKNVDVMTEAVEEALAFDEQYLKQKKKAEKKAKRKLQKSLEESVEMNGTSESHDIPFDENEDAEMQPVKKKKKSKKIKVEAEEMIENNVDEENIAVPKKKKRKLEEATFAVKDEEEVEVAKKKKKSKKNKSFDSSVN